MATRKRTATTIDQAKIDDVFPVNQQPPQQQFALPAPEADIDDFDDYDDVTALNTVLSELGAEGGGGGGFITVFKEFTLNGSKTEKYMGRHAVADFASGTLLEHLKNTFGGGRYHIRVYHSSGRGLAANKMIDIEGDTVAPVISAPQAPAVDLSPITQAMAQMQSNFEKLLSAMVQSQPKQQSRLEMMEEMRVMRDVFAPPVQAAQPVNNPLELIKLGVEMAGNGNGGDGNNAWVGKIIDTLGAPMMEMIMKNATAAPITASPALPRPQLPQSQPIPQPQQQPQQTNEDDSMNLMLTGYLKMLERAAANNADVGEHADNILNVIPPSSLPEFETMLRANDWQVRLSAHSQIINKYPVWFTGLRNTIIAFIDEDRAELNGGGNLTDKTGADSVQSHETSDTPQPAPNGNTGITT
jgi:hypothetical protein